MFIRRVTLRCVFFFQAEDGIRDPLWSRGLGDVYKRQVRVLECQSFVWATVTRARLSRVVHLLRQPKVKR